MKTELHKLLSPLEKKHLQSLKEYFDQVNSGYLRAMPRKDAEFLANIYRQLSGTHTNLNCSKCVFEMVKYINNYL